MEIQIHAAGAITHKGFSAASVRSVLPARLLVCLLGVLECDAVWSSLLPTVFVDRTYYFFTFWWYFWSSLECFQPKFIRIAPCVYSTCSTCVVLLLILSRLILPKVWCHSSIHDFLQLETEDLSHIFKERAVFLSDTDHQSHFFFFWPSLGVEEMRVLLICINDSLSAKAASKRRRSAFVTLSSVCFIAALQALMHTRGIIYSLIAKHTQITSKI